MIMLTRVSTHFFVFFTNTFSTMFYVLLRCSCNCCFHEHILLWGDLNWVIVFVNVVYVDQGISALLKSVFFGGVLSDVNYEYLLMKLREIIDKNGFEVGWYFWNFKNFFKNIFFQVHYFWVWRLFVGVYCGFGGFDLFLGLGV